MKQTNFSIRGIGLWAIAFATVAISLAVLFGAAISPWWILFPIAIPIASVMFLLALAVSLVLVVFVLVLAGLLVSIVPLLAIFFCATTLEVTGKSEKKVIEN